MALQEEAIRYKLGMKPHVVRGVGKMDKDKVIDLRTKARPVRVRDQHEIIEERRKKRREKFESVKKEVRRIFDS
jgi:hypothetical protein